MTENITRGRYIAEQIEDISRTVWAPALLEKVAKYIEAQLSPANDEADHARKRASKIRESFLASVRANTNLLASMTAEEREEVRNAEYGKVYRFSYDAWARRTARELMVETWGQEAVDAALGAGS